MSAPANKPTPQPAPAMERITLADYRLEHDVFLDQAAAQLSRAEFVRLMFDLETSLRVRQNKFNAQQAAREGVAHG